MADKIGPLRPLPITNGDARNMSAPTEVPQDDLAAQIQSYGDEQIKHFSGLLQAAQANANVGAWGGSDDDALHWNSVASNYGTRLNQIKDLMPLILDSGIKSGLTADDLPAIKKAISQGSLQQQQLEEHIDVLRLAKSEHEKQSKARQDLIAAIPGLRQQMGDELLKQEEFALSRIRPQIEQSLNSRGLLQSGALAEAIIRAQRDLEASRQARLGEFEIGAQGLANIQLPLEEVQSNIDLFRAGIQRKFGTSDVNTQNQFQLSMLARQQELARSITMAQVNMARQRAMGGLIGGGAGLALGAGAGLLLGGLPGALIGGGVGGMFGNQFGSGAALAF